MRSLPSLSASGTDVILRLAKGERLRANEPLLDGREILLRSRGDRGSVRREKLRGEQACFQSPSRDFESRITNLTQLSRFR
jgi:hypothetical protein